LVTETGRDPVMSRKVRFPYEKGTVVEREKTGGVTTRGKIPIEMRGELAEDEQRRVEKHVGWGGNGC